jgi:uncharacterized SAM-binding protein YcdF (DUF218 family)
VPCHRCGSPVAGSRWKEKVVAPRAVHCQATVPMFLFKKLVGPLLFPVPITLALLLAGLLVLWFSRRQRAGKVLVTAALLWLAAFSFRPLPGALLGSLEATYPTFEAARAGQVPVRWVVVLDGGASAHPMLAPPDQLAPSTLARVVEGMRVLAHYPEARLLLCGGPLTAEHTTARVMQTVAVALGADPARITLEGAGHDTEQQAAYVRAIVHDDPLVLVTSAAHMRRAVALFRRQGLAPVPAPTDHWIKPEPFDPAHLFPESGYLEQATRWFYETLGLTWARLRGRA